MRSTVATAILGFALAACAGSDPAAPPASQTATAAPAVETAEPSTSKSPVASNSASASPPQSPAVGSALVVDGLAKVLVSDLSLRAEPSTAAERIGLLPLGEPAYVVAGPVEADGHPWYQLAAVRQPYVGECGDPAPEPSLECASWFGWSAGVSAAGDRWLEAIRPDCPPALNTEAYLSLLPAERLACAGSAEWRLRAYVAPSTGGRGCYPVYVVDPMWLDASCNLSSFLQPEESEYDDFTGLQVFVHPDVGGCTLRDERMACPFEALRGSWIEITGQLDHPVAHECSPTLSDTFEDAPYPPPPTDEVVFRCRTQFVVSRVDPG
jgi:hypothetical protein